MEAQSSGVYSATGLVVVARQVVVPAAVNGTYSRRWYSSGVRLLPAGRLRPMVSVLLFMMT